MKLIISYILKKPIRKGEPKLLTRFEVGWTQTDADTLEFLHQEASIRVKDTVEDHHSITKKAFSLILLFVAISSTLGGYLLSNKYYVQLDAIVTIALLVSLFSIYLLSELIRPVNFRAPGRIPDKVLVNKIYSPNRSIENRKKLILYQELLNCQAQIEMNQYYNTIRLTIIDFIVRLVIISFISLGVVLTIIKLVS